MTKHRVKRAWEMAAKVRQGGRPLSEDQTLRRRLAALEAELKALEITNLRMVAEMARGGADPRDTKPSILKLKGTELQQLASEVLFDIGGYEGLPVRDRDTDLAEDWAARLAPSYFQGRAASIYGGSNEIQRNVVAKSLLGN